MRCRATLAGATGLSPTQPGRQSDRGAEATAKEIDDAGGDARPFAADVSKAKRLLAYSPLVGFAEGFRRTVEYFRALA